MFTGANLPIGLADSTGTRTQCQALGWHQAVVCDRTAAWLWGVDVHDPDERFTVPDIEIAVAPGQVRLTSRAD